MRLHPEFSGAGADENGFFKVSIHSLEGFFKSPIFQITLYDIILFSIDLGPQLYALHWLL